MSPGMYGRERRARGDVRRSRAPRGPARRVPAGGRRRAPRRGRWVLVALVLISGLVATTIYLRDGEGNATIAITLDTYSHVLPDMREKAARAMEEALGT